MPETIVLTGAGGNQCSYLIPLLSTDPAYKLRLVVHSQKSLARLQQKFPNAEVVTADLAVAESCRTILSGATAVYHIGPSFHAREAEIGMNMVDAAVAESAARGSNFKHFVFSSVLDTQLSKLIHHDRKKRVEEYLMESPLLCWTILQPTHFGDTVVRRLIGAASSAKDGEKAVFQTFIPPDVVFSYMSLTDLSVVAVKVLKEREKHFCAYYPLCSTEKMPYESFVKRVGRELGTEFEIKLLNFEQALNAILMAAVGTTDVNQRTRDAPERMLLFYTRKGLVGNPNVMRWLLGREPTDVEDIVKTVLATSK